MCIFFTFIHFTNRKHSRCGERDKIYMTNFQHGWGKKLKTSLVINYFFFIDSLTTGDVHSCSAGWIGLITHTMGSSMPKSKILLQISGDVPTEKIYFTTAGAKKNLKAHFKVCLGNLSGHASFLLSVIGPAEAWHEHEAHHLWTHTYSFFSTLDY